jgi:NADH-quinone oxidoreductase subunit M
MFFDSYLLSLIITIPLLGAVMILFIDNSSTDKIRNIALISSMSTFFLSTILWVVFDRSTSQFQFVEEFLWIPSSNINFYVGVDGISLFFIILTALLIPLCILASWDSVKIYVKEYMIAFLVMETLLLIVFSILDIM